jgi:ABC-type phosphate/phosphonate transport system substrate-binding protein
MENEDARKKAKGGILVAKVVGDMNWKGCFLFALLASLLFVGCGSGDGGGLVGTDEKPIKIGYMICNSLEESRARFEPITAYLAEKVGRRFESVLVNTHEFEDLVRDKKVDFAHSNSILYIIFAKDYGAKLIATDVRGRHGHRDTGAIITRKESGIKTFEDMRGKTMIFGPALAPFGYMSQYYLMLTNGIDPEKDLGFYAIPWGSYKHEKLIYGVELGAFDMGAAPRIDLDAMGAEGKINLDDFHIIAEGIPMPYCTVCALAHVDPGLAQKVRETLLGLKRDETVLVGGEVLNICKRALIDGFVSVDDSEYDPIREQLKRCNMAPYSSY